MAFFIAMNQMRRSPEFQVL